MFVTNWISTTKIQKISEITNFFRHYFLSRTEVDFKLNVPGLQKWGDFYDNHDNSQTFEQWWQEGWMLAKEIRRQLPARIDLYYMCFNPKCPDKIIDYQAGFPRIIVPQE